MANNKEYQDSLDNARNLAYAALDKKHSQTAFTKARADIAMACVMEIIEFVPKRKRAEIFGEANDLMLFINAAKRAAPENPAEN